MIVIHCGHRGGQRGAGKKAVMETFITPRKTNSHWQAAALFPRILNSFRRATMFKAQLKAIKSAIMEEHRYEGHSGNDFEPGLPS